jgi:hypothetical protein
VPASLVPLLPPRLATLLADRGGRAGVGRRWRGRAPLRALARACGSWIRGGCDARELDSRRLRRAGVRRTAWREVREAVGGRERGQSTLPP